MIKGWNIWSVLKIAIDIYEADNEGKFIPWSIFLHGYNKKIISLKYLFSFNIQSGTR